MYYIYINYVLKKLFFYICVFSENIGNIYIYIYIYIYLDLTVVKLNSNKMIVRNNLVITNIYI